jgi:hypothetical protein
MKNTGGQNLEFRTILPLKFLNMINLDCFLGFNRLMLRTFRDTASGPPTIAERNGRIIMKDA